MTIRSIAQLTVFAVALSPLLGCGAAEDASAASGDEPLTSTVVVRHSDGTLSSSTYALTREQEEAENEARRRAGAPTAATGARPEYTNFGTCASTDLWIYDAPNATGNRLCLQNSGPPSPFQLSWVGWSGRVKSYWAGSDYGYFNSQGCTDLFPAWGSPMNEIHCTPATTVTLDKWPIQ